MTAAKLRRLWIVPALMCVSRPAPAVDLTSAYAEAVLRDWQPRYASTTTQMARALMGDIIGQPPAFTDAQRRQLGAVEIRFPLPSEQTGPELAFRGDPMMFYSRLNPPLVVMPVLSLKFFSDMCLAYVWLEQNGYEMASPTIYMKLVKYNRPARFPNGRYPPLLQAVHIPDNARNNSEIEQRYFEAFNDLRAFILLHELGHIYYRHAAILGDRQKQELEADSFALEALHRLGATPGGALFYFTAAANLQLNRSDFASDAAWKEYLGSLTHPANELRLQRAADYVRENATSFAREAYTGIDAGVAVREIADSLAKVAKLLADPESPMVPPRSNYVDLSPLALHKR